MIWSRIKALEIFFRLGLGHQGQTQSRFSPVYRNRSSIVQNELIVKKDEPFQIALKIKNRSQTGRLWRGSFITSSHRTWKIILT